MLGELGNSQTPPNARRRENAHSAAGEVVARKNHTPDHPEVVKRTLENTLINVAFFTERTPGGLYGLSDSAGVPCVPFVHPDRHLPRAPSRPKLWLSPGPSEIAPGR